MSDSTDSTGSTPSLAATVDKYNTYGLATQGYVWAVLSSVSGDWGKGYVKSVNGVLPDSDSNVSVTSISATDYSGELNQINADRTVIIGGEDGHRLLTDIDNTLIRSHISSVSGEFKSKFDVISSLIPSEASSDNRLADRNYVSEQIARQGASYRGSWNTVSDIPSDSSLYPVDADGKRTPKQNDYLIVRDASPDHDGTWRYIYLGTWSTDGKNGWKAEYQISSVAFTEEQWAAIDSGIDSGIVDVLTSTSADWQKTFNTVHELSGRWNRAATEVYETSAKYRNIYNEFSNASSTWNSAVEIVSSLSGDWNESVSYTREVSSRDASTYGTVNTLSGRWNSASSEIESLSSNRDRWNNAASSIESASGDIYSVFGTVTNLSSGWNNATGTVNESSGNWSSVYHTVETASAKWSESEGSTKAYTDFIGTSALTSANKYTDETTSSAIGTAAIYASFIASSALSTADEHTDGKIAEEHAFALGVTTTVSSASSNWNSVYGAFSAISSYYSGSISNISSASGAWDGATSIVASHSAVWDESSGSTKEYTDMMTTSALSTAEKYSDSLYASSRQYSEYTAASALTAADANADVKIANIYDVFRGYAVFTATSAVSTAAGYSDFIAASALSSANDYSDERAQYAISESNIYTDFVASSAVTASIGYSDFIAASAVSSAYSYTDFMSASALSSANIYTDFSSEILSGYAIFTSASALSEANTYTDIVSSGLNRTVTYTIPFSSTSGIEECSELFGYANNGDVIVIKKQLFDGAVDNYRYTSFTYSNGDWLVMDGDHSVDEVFFTDNLTTTFDIGKEKIDPEIGYKILDTKGKSVETIVNQLFSCDKYPDVVNPYIETLELTSIGKAEVGTTVVPKMTIIPHTGSYSYGPECNCQFDTYYVSFNGEEWPITNGRIENIDLPSITVTDEMSSYSDSRTVCVSAHYTDDTVTPLTLFGKTAETYRIMSGYTDLYRYPVAVTGFRRAFTGSLAIRAYESYLTSSVLRGLNARTDEQLTESTVLTAVLKSGDLSVIFAYPYSLGEASSITEEYGFEGNIKDAFTMTTSEVYGNNSRYSIKYYVYYRNIAEASESDTKYYLRFKD